MEAFGGTRGRLLELLEPVRSKNDFSGAKRSNDYNALKQDARACQFTSLVERRHLVNSNLDTLSLYGLAGAVKVI